MFEEIKKQNKLISTVLFYVYTMVMLTMTAMISYQDTNFVCIWAIMVFIWIDLFFWFTGPNLEDYKTIFGVVSVLGMGVLCIGLIGPLTQSILSISSILSGIIFGGIIAEVWLSSVGDPKKLGWISLENIGERIKKWKQKKKGLKPLSNT